MVGKIILNQGRVVRPSQLIRSVRPLVACADGADGKVTLLP
jgi:hypothetical protein